MNLWLFAHDDIGFFTLDYIMSAFPEDISCVVTMEKNDIYKRGIEYGVKAMLFEQNDLTAMCQLLERPDLGMLAWWPKIIKQELISIPKKGFINTHPSFLPYNQGKNYNFWALVEQCPFGVSIHSVVPEIDAGDIVAQRSVSYDWIDTGESMFHKAKEAMKELIKEAYPLIRQLEWQGVPQAKGVGSFHYAGEMDVLSRIEIDKQYTARELFNLLRARTFGRHPACWFEDNGEQYEIRVNISRKKGKPPMTSQKEQFEQDCLQEIIAQGKDARVADISRKWMDAVTLHKYSYHFTWLGRPIIQYPQDIVAMQEIITSVRPDLIIETGIAHGGGLIFYASLLELNAVCGGPANARVLGIDIDIREHNRKAIEAHPMMKRISMIHGSSIAPETVKQVKGFAAGYSRILVCLDSNHTHTHVLAELEAYAGLVSRDSYCVVFDTVIEDMPENSFPDRPWDRGDNPKTAVNEFLASHPEFTVDAAIDSKLMISVAPGGYLKRS